MVLGSNPKMVLGSNPKMGSAWDYFHTTGLGVASVFSGAGSCYDLTGTWGNAGYFPSSRSFLWPVIGSQQACATMVMSK
jgi:hypothetical protein